MFNRENILDTNLFFIFNFVLIISANFLVEIFPCNLQYKLRNNMLFKHMFGIFTMIFFVRLSDSSTNNGNGVNYSFNTILKNSLFLYLFFIVFSKCNIYFFYLILFLIGLTYIIKIIKDEDKNKNITDKDVMNRQERYNNITYMMYILIFILTILGMIVYMGEKKNEYKKDFNYFTFFIGKQECIHKSPSINIIQALKGNFTKF